MPFWRFTWLTALGSLPWVLGFALIGRGGRRQLGKVAPPPADARLPGGRGDRRPDRLLRSSSGGGRRLATTRAPARRRRRPARAALERGRSRDGSRPGARSRWASSRDRRSCCRSPAPPTSSCVPWLAGWDWERDRPRGPQELRGGAARRRGGGAADRPAPHDRRGAARVRRPARAGARPLLPAGGGRRLHAGAADRAAAGRAAGDRVRPARRRGGDAGRRHPARSSAGAARRPPPTGWRWASPRRRRWRRASPATASPWPRRAGGASRATRRTCSRARSRCRSSSAPPASRAPGSPAAAPRPSCARSLAVGVAASFASTLASQRLIGLVERDRALWPYAAYRAALAAAVLASCDADGRHVIAAGSDRGA